MRTTNTSALRVTLSLALGALGGCRSETRSQLPESRDAVVAHTLPTRGWEVRDDGRLAGSVLLQEQTGAPERGYYSVRNREGQVLGLVDFQGRAWRYRVHREEPEWIGTGTVLEGARRILATSALAVLVEAELASLERDR